MNGKFMLLMRGPSGSGKSMLSEHIKHVLVHEGIRVVICSADYYFLNEDTGEYQFDANLLGEAHTQCKRQVYEYAVYLNTPVIIIDNTNTTFSEVLPYMELAMKYNYQFIMVEPFVPNLSDVAHYHSRNVHDVPLETVKKQIERYVPSWRIVCEYIVRTMR